MEPLSNETIHSILYDVDENIFAFRFFVFALFTIWCNTSRSSFIKNNAKNANTTHAGMKYSSAVCRISSTKFSRPCHLAMLQHPPPPLLPQHANETSHSCRMKVLMCSYIFVPCVKHINVCFFFVHYGIYFSRFFIFLLFVRCALAQIKEK